MAADWHGVSGHRLEVLRSSSLRAWNESVRTGVLQAGGDAAGYQVAPHSVFKVPPEAETCHPQISRHQNITECGNLRRQRNEWAWGRSNQSWVQVFLLPSQHLGDITLFNTGY